MAVNLSPYGGVGAQFLDNAGNVLTGGRIETYAAGTTTPQAVYTTSAGNIFHSNPIILDASGRVPSGGEIWLTDGLLYKFVLRDSNNVLIATYDNIAGINSNFVNFTSEQEIQTATAGQTVFTLTTVNYTPGTNSLSVFVDGVNQYGPGAQYAYLETNSTTVTFVNGLHVGASVKFTTAAALTGTATNANVVIYDPAGVNAVSTTVQAKLRETVSVKDFGAVGDGVVDDTAAITSALDFCITEKLSLYFPSGVYLYAPASTYQISTSGVADAQSLKIYGEGANQTIIDIDFNGVAFDVDNYYTRGALILEDISFRLLDPTTNNNATAFYFRSRLGGVLTWGASWQISRCNFLNFTNSAIHGVEIFFARTTGCRFIGNSPYTATSGLLATYDDAGVRMWGADGTSNLQSHSFSNMNLFENCIFGRTKFGFDGWNAYQVEFQNCTFEPNWIGLSNKRVPSNPVGINTSTEKGGGAFAAVTYNSCWFEQNALYHVSNVNVNNSGVDVDPLITSLLQGGNNYATNVALQNAKNRFRVLSGGFTAAIDMQGTSLATVDPNYVLTQAFTNNPNEIFYRITSTAATFNIPTTFSKVTNIGGNWNGSHPIMLNNAGNPYHLWVDISGKLRIKLNAPTSDTDGTVVGTQI